MLTAPGETRIRALKLRTPPEKHAGAIRALEGADWDLVPPHEILILRHVRARGPVEALGRLALQQARRQAAQAVSGWAAAAESVPAVRFASREDLTACLLHDLLRGRPRWFWRGWQALFGLPPGRAAVSLLTGAPLLWPGIVRRLESSAAGPYLWPALAREDAAHLLALLGRATGWALTRDAHDPAGGGDAPARAVARAQPSLRGGESVMDRAGAETVGWLARMRPMLAPDGPDSPRTRLAVATWLWLNAPQRLAGAGASVQIDRLARWLCEAPAGPATGLTASPVWHASAAGATPAPDASGVAREACRSAVADHPGPHAGTGRRVHSPLPVQTGREPLSMREGRPVPDAPRPGVDVPRDDAPPADAMTRIAIDRACRDDREPAGPGQGGEVRIVTRQGGWFLLLNALQLPALQALLKNAPPAPCPAAGWFWLYRLGRSLGGVADPPLLRFLADLAGLEPEQELEALPPLPGEAELARLTRARYGDAVCNPTLFSRPALLLSTPSHLDVHYRMADLRLDVRRAALDVNPGWLHWLGRVVNFHYGQPAELAGLQP